MLCMDMKDQQPNSHPTQASIQARDNLRCWLWVPSHSKVQKCSIWVFIHSFIVDLQRHKVTWIEVCWTIRPHPPSSQDKSEQVATAESTVLDIRPCRMLSGWTLITTTITSSATSQPIRPAWFRSTQQWEHPACSRLSTLASTWVPKQDKAHL